MIGVDSRQRMIDSGGRVHRPRRRRRSAPLVRLEDVALRRVLGTHEFAVP
jgi:hypothetical protein